MKIIFASGNIDKLNQIKLILSNIDLVSPKDLEINHFEVIEDGKTLEENAYKKAKAIYDMTKSPVFADDTGLFVDALNGDPGVYSHRYANENPSYKENRDKLLRELQMKVDRRAKFITSICYIDENGEDHYFKGTLNGTITNKEIGTYEFGYDQIFMPDGLDKTLGQMTNEKINEISHRSMAIKEFKKFLENNYENINN